jgi:hypothetical protein
MVVIAALQAQNLSLLDNASIIVYFTDEERAGHPLA